MSGIILKTCQNKNKLSFIDVIQDSIKVIRNDVAFDDEMLLEYAKGNISETEYYCSLVYRIPYKHGMKIVWIE